ncbi:MAG TPA: ABC transporter permease subunit [Trinickia sp.]|jgi:oligopeptide transport system permease protein|nr:ABC transporter permease subunit [Trinickia sp.]
MAAPPSSSSELFDASDSGGGNAYDGALSRRAKVALRFMRNRTAVVSLAVLVTVVLVCFAGPFVLGQDPARNDWTALALPPTLEGGHWFGTDELGRDLFVRTLVGGRVSLEVGLLGTIAACLIGVAYGACAGYFGGRVDAVMMRIVDLMYAVPYMLIAILVMTFFGREFYLVILTISAFSWLDMARVARGQTLSLRTREFVDAARAIGVPGRAIVFRHIVPNLLGIAVVYATVMAPGVVLTESVLSFLGLGVQEPMTSWGVLIEDGAQKLEAMPWLLLGPAAMLCTTLYCVGFVGDGLRDALDPKEP